MDTETAMATDVRNRPIQEIRIGMVKAAIWAHDTEAGERFNVSFSRIYHKEGEWRSTDSFGRDDLLVLAKLADRCHSWITDSPRRDEGPVATEGGSSSLAAATMPKSGRPSRQRRG